MPEPVLIYGSRILARLARDLVEADPALSFAGYVNDWEGGPDILGSLEEVPKHPLVPAIGYTDLAARWQAVERAQASGFPLATLQHASVIRSPHAEIGGGSILMARAVVEREAVLGRAVVLWPGAIVNHECQVGDNVFLSAHCTLAGGSQVGAHSFVGVGATLVDHVKVGSNCFIGAGVLVFADLPDHSRVVARPNFVRT